MSARAGLDRRELLLAGAGLVCGGCATLPELGERLRGGSPDPSQDRRCDHDLCRFWRADPSVAAPTAQGEPRLGRCSIGLPEDL